MNCGNDPSQVFLKTIFFMTMSQLFVLQLFQVGNGFCSSVVPFDAGSCSNIRSTPGEDQNQNIIHIEIAIHRRIIMMLLVRVATRQDAFRQSKDTHLMETTVYKQFDGYFANYIAKTNGLNGFTCMSIVVNRI